MSHNAPGPCRPEDIGDVYYRADSFPQPETTPHPSFPERERANAPPHSMPMVSASGCTAPIFLTEILKAGLPLPRTSGSPKWGAPASHSGVQEQRYDVSYNAWPDAQPERNVPYAPVIANPIQYLERSPGLNYLSFT